MRNFEEEYKNYINEEVPDLWSRIEPQLQDKIVDSQQKATNNNIYIFAKRVLPAVAAILVLVIGIGVLQTSRYAKNETEMAVATDFEAEEATDEAFYAEATEEEPVESFADTEVLEEACEAAPEDEFCEEADEAASEEMQNSMDVVKENESASKSDAGLSIPGQDVVAIKGAVLNGIEVADAVMQEKGYVYIYRFILADGNKIRVYLTEELCQNIEEAELVIARKKKYDLDIIPYSDQDKEDDLADCILQDIQAANN